MVSQEYRQRNYLSVKETNPQIIQSTRRNSVTENVLSQTKKTLGSIDSVLQGSRAKELEKIAELQRKWDKSLGIENDGQKTGEFIQYNPVFARWGWERTQTDTEKKAFQEAEIFNIKTALRERNHTERSDMKMYFDTNGKIRNEAFLQEPWEEVLQRGVDYRKENGSQETEREEAEVVGFAKICNEFATAEEGAMAVMISPPGLVEDSIYDHNFVDVYRLAKDKNGKRYIEYTRFASPLDYTVYEEIAKSFDPEYFSEKTKLEKQNKKEIPLDAWYLGNPFLISADAHCKNTEEMFSKHFEKDVKAMEEKEFNDMWRVYLPYVLYFLEQVTRDDFDPIAIAKAWNTVHHSVENKTLLQQGKEIPIFVAPERTVLDPRMQQKIAAMVNQYGEQEVKEVGSGCGGSGGFSIGGKDSRSPFANSVASFGVKGGRKEEEWFVCSECGWHADGPIGNSACGGCGFTKADYAKKYGIVCD